MPYLSWDDHPGHVMNLIGQMYEDSEFTDCTLDTNGGLVRGHKTLLVACSPYLKKLIVDHQGMEIIPLKDVRFNDMKLILDFVYFGEVDISLTDVISFREAARLLQIPSLSDYFSAISEKPPSYISCDENLPDSMANSTMNLIKYEDSDLSVQNRIVVCNQDIDHENDYRLISNCENTCNSEIHTANVLKDFPQTSNKIITKSNFENSNVSEIDMINEGTDNFQGDSTPFTFVAVSPFSVKESDNEELNTLISTLSDEKNPLEENRESGVITKKIKMERDFLCESEVKKEIEEEDNDNVSDDGNGPMEVDCISCEMDDKMLKITENSSGKESIRNVTLMKAVGCGSSEDCFAEATQDLQIEFESICDIPKHEWGKVNPLETYSDNESIDDDRDLLESNEMYESLQCVEEHKPPINLKGHLTAASPVLITKGLGLNDHSAYQEWSRSRRTSTGKDCKLERRSRELLDAIQSDIVISETKCGGFEPLKANGRVYFTRNIDQEHNTIIGGRQNHMGSKLKRFSCNICDQSFKSGDMLKKHRLIHVGKKQFKCDDCGVTFSWNRSLRRHKLIHTGIKPFKCDDCDATFFENSHLKEHKRIHTGIKPFKCDNCGATFSRSSSLNKHKSIHTGIKPFKCDDCGFPFARNCDLKKHKSIHTGIKPFKCDDCGTTFARKGTLKEHKLTHSRIKQFKCDDCGAIFSQNGRLMRHKLNHTGIKRVMIVESHFLEKII